MIVVELRIRTDVLLRIRAWLRGAMLVASTLIVVGMFLGWYRSGTRLRNSFEMMRVPQELGLEGFTTIRTVWFVLPVLTAGVIGFVLLGRIRLAAVVLGVQSLVAIVVAAVVIASSISVGFGPAVTATAGLVGLTAAALAALVH